MPAVDSRNDQQSRTFPPPLNMGIELVSAGVERARNINVLGLATLPFKAIGAVKHPRRTAAWAYEEVTELGGALITKFRGGDDTKNDTDTETKPAEPLPTQEEVAEMVEQVTDPFGLSDEVAQQVEDATPGATLTHDQLPLEDYDHLTLGSLRARLTRLDAVSLVQLRDYERAHANRLPVLTMLENRIAKVANNTQ